MVAASRPPGWPGSEHRRIEGALRSVASGDPEASLRGYLGSPVPVLGVRTPELRRIAKESAARLRGRPTSDARALVRQLWAGRHYEERSIAIELLGRPPLVDDPAAFRLGTRWVDRATGWALSDSLASGPIATMAYAHPERFRELLAWTRSRNLWRRRASTYALRGWVRAGELDRPLGLLDRLSSDPERWVQRAVGTWLRECWKKDRVRTEKLLLSRARRLSAVTITVATERASRRFRTELRRRAGAARGRGY